MTLETVIMMHASLAAIGRLQQVEVDDPPVRDSASTTVYPPSESVESQDDAQYQARRAFATLQSEDLREIVECSEKRFNFMPWLRTGIPSGINNIEMHHADLLVQSASDFYSVRKLEQRLQELELRRQIATRLSDFEDLCKQADRLTIQEMHLLDCSKRDCNPESANSNLGYLRTLCENLRLCINQALTLSSYVQENSILQQIMHRVKPLLDSFLQRHQRLSGRSVLTTHQLIQAGLLVLSHSDLTRYTYDDLWEISRGIEEFNNLLEDLQRQRRVKLHRLYVLGHTERIDQYLDQIDVMKPVSFSKILYKLALERSIQLVSGIHNFFHASKDLVKTVKHKRDAICKMYNWKNYIREVGFTDILCEGSSSGDCNDDDEDEEENDDSRPFDDLFESVVDNLVNEGSPLNDSLRLEYEFASNFLDVISQSTEMLKELQDPKKKKRLQKTETLDNFIAPPVIVSPPSPTTSENGNIFSDGASSDNSDSASAVILPKISAPTQAPAKKGVQWSDHKEVRLRHYVISRYLDLVWQEVTRQMSSMAHCHLYCSSYDSAKRSLGSHLLLPPEVQLFLSDIMIQESIKDLFPSSLIPTLREQSINVKTNAMYSNWDKCMRLVQATSRKDSMPLVVLPTRKADNIHCSLLVSHVFSIAVPLVTHMWHLLDLYIGQGSPSSKSASSDSVPLINRLSQSSTLFLSIINCYFTTLHLPSTEDVSPRITHTTADSSSSPEPYIWNRSLCDLLIVLHSDLPLLNELIKCLLDRIKRPLTANRRKLDASSPPYIALLENVSQLQDLNSKIKNVRENLISEFSSRCSSKASQLFEDLMPDSQYWLRQVSTPPTSFFHKLCEVTNGGSSQNDSVSLPGANSRHLINTNQSHGAQPTSTPTRFAAGKSMTQIGHSDYASAVVSAVLTDVVSAVAELTTTAQIQAIEPALSALCSAWKRHIFNKQIKFSYWGACQFHEDIQSLEVWLSQFISNSDVFSYLLSTSAFRDLKTGAEALKSQPQSVQSPVLTPINNIVSKHFPSFIVNSSSPSHSSAASSQTQLKAELDWASLRFHNQDDNRSKTSINYAFK